MLLSPLRLCVVVLACSCAQDRRSEPAPSAGRQPDPPAATTQASSQTAVDPPKQAEALPDVRTEWCPEPWHGLDENTCWLAPERPPSSLLVYLSGIVPPGPPGPLQANMQHVVARAALRADAAVLLPRGRTGLGPAATRRWWSWPTAKADVDRLAPELVQSWLAARARLETSLGPFPRTFLAGSSSGAYFLTALAVRGALEVDGLAATAGGGTTAAALAGAERKPPFYLGFGKSDPAASQLRAFGKVLQGSGWPARVREHPGGHGAREVYLDEAFAFWHEHAGPAR